VERGAIVAVASVCVHTGPSARQRAVRSITVQFDDVSRSSYCILSGGSVNRHTRSFEAPKRALSTGRQGWTRHAARRG